VSEERGDEKGTSAGNDLGIYKVIEKEWAGA
jgi:hypothetical protein